MAQVADPLQPSAHRASLPPSATASLLRGVLALAWIALLIYLGLGAFRVSVQPEGAEAPVGTFSAERALDHVRTIAGQPRPTGSPGHREAQRYLLGRLESLGLETEIQRTTVAWGRWKGRVQATEVVNLLGRLGGSPAAASIDKALLLMAHYDSVPMGPGAADDASGVAVILEAVRTLKAGAPLTHDLMVVLTDAEELGLFGAQAFALRHPWIERAGVVINLEGRGGDGPAAMFRTSRGNGPLIRALKATPHPVAISLTDAIFQRMGNDTDLTRTLAADVPGMDIAILGDSTRYHSALDSVAQLSPASVQQEGENLVALVRALDAGSLERLRGPDQVFFSLFGHLWTYPAAWGLILAGAGLGLFVLALVLGSRALRQTHGTDSGAAAGGIAALVGRSLGGTLTTLLGAFLAWLVLTFLWQQVQGLDGDFRSVAQGSSYELGLYGPALLLMAATVALAVAVVARRMLGIVAVALGAALLWLILAVAAAVALPGGGYFFVVPVLVSLAAWSVSFLVSGGASGDSPPFAGWVSWAFGALGATALLLLVPATAWLIVKAMGLPLAPAIAVLVALAVPLALPLLEPFAGAATVGRALALPGIALGAALVLLILPAMNEVSGTAKTPRATNLFYALKAGSGEALWLTHNPNLDPWQRQYLGDDPQRRKIPELVRGGPPDGFLAAAGPTLPLPPPKIEATAVPKMTEDGSAYIMPVRITSVRGAPTLHLAIESLAAVQKLKINDWTWDYRSEPFHSRDDVSWMLTFTGEGGRPLELTLELTDRQPVEFIVVDQSYQLPPGSGMPPRPPETMGQPSDWLTDSTFVQATAQF